VYILPQWKILTGKNKLTERREKWVRISMHQEWWLTDNLCGEYEGVYFMGPVIIIGIWNVLKYKAKIRIEEKKGKRYMPVIGTEMCEYENSASGDEKRGEPWTQFLP
jgi:hypothetical protein